MSAPSAPSRRGKVVWLTGLPGSGKSTIAHAVESRLSRSGFQTAILDGDHLRLGLCSDLGYSIEDRRENIRRAGEVAKLFLASGTVVFVALISPFKDARDKARQLFDEGDFVEVYCQCPLDVCRSRDPKGLYAKAESGRIAEFTGITSPYEAPVEADLVLDTAKESAEASIEKLFRFLTESPCRIE